MTAGGLILIGGLLTAVLGSQASAPARGSSNVLTPEEKAAGWRLLFDGKTTNGWRGYRQEGMTDGWQAVDGALTRVGKGGDIVTADQFQDFELVLEWKVAPGGNSGVFFRATEDTASIWQNSTEYQILDNGGHADGKNPLTSTASNYALYAPSKDVSKPAGEWNVSRIVARGPRVEHWLNGEKVVEYRIESEEWTALVAKSKFGKYPTYGRAPQGHIGLQDHGDYVAFRNIKIRPL